MLLPAPFPRGWLFSFYSQWPWCSQYLNPTFPKLFLHSATLEPHSHLKSGQDFPYSYLDWFTIVGLSLLYHCHFIHLSLSPSPLCSYYDNMVSYGGPAGARQQDFEMYSVTSAFCLPPLLQDMCGRKVMYVKVLYNDHYLWLSLFIYIFLTTDTCLLLRMQMEKA